jgi:hypothetical protein
MRSASSLLSAPSSAPNSAHSVNSKASSVSGIKSIRSVISVAQYTHYKHFTCGATSVLCVPSCFIIRQLSVWPRSRAFFIITQAYCVPIWHCHLTIIILSSYDDTPVFLDRNMSLLIALSSFSDRCPSTLLSRTIPQQLPVQAAPTVTIAETMISTSALRASGAADHPPPDPLLHCSRAVRSRSQVTLQLTTTDSYSRAPHSSRGPYFITISAKPFFCVGFAPDSVARCVRRQQVASRGRFFSSCRRPPCFSNSSCPRSKCMDSCSRIIPPQ